MSTSSLMDTSLTGGRRHRRSWPDALKVEIVKAALAPGASVSVVARRYDVNANQVFNWRKRYREGRLVPPASGGGLAMVPVAVTPEVGPAVASGVSDAIEIELSGGYRVRVGRGEPAAGMLGSQP